MHLGLEFIWSAFRVNFSSIWFVKIDCEPAVRAFRETQTPTPSFSQRHAYIVTSIKPHRNERCNSFVASDLRRFVGADLRERGEKLTLKMNGCQERMISLKLLVDVQVK
ncbi:unnamed protein product [Sphenostylis stenocarpa]|uniref:Uncharacterized protein n=1 Tax=Sphenostylis stenocarpa TaxID=92480 RepID=A0AA86S1I9_9FABA|nr:unnamed protein product [Sphenostylis stenocarpa]